jgi:DNA transformation protein
MGDGGLELATRIADQLADIGQVEYRRLFGGYGIELNGVHFGMVIHGTPYVRVDDALRDELKTLGMTPFSYSRKSGKEIVAHNLYSVPEEWIEDRERLAELAWRSRAAAVEAKKKPSKKRKSPGAALDAAAADRDNSR